MKITIVPVPDFFQETLPFAQWKYHYEVRVNGKTQHYAETPELAQAWVNKNVNL